MAAIALLFSAGNTVAERLPSHAGPCDSQGPSGICVRVETDAWRFDLAALEAAYLQAKREVETRYQLDLTGVAGPVVRVMSFANFARLYPANSRADGDTRSHFGWTAFASGEITLTGPAVMRHEAFHYLLWKAGYPNRLNAAHDHPVFDDYRNRKSPPKRTTPPLPTATTRESQVEPASLSTPPSAAGLVETTAR